jgi:hypothetical protein
MSATAGKCPHCGDVDFSDYRQKMTAGTAWAEKRNQEQRLGLRIILAIVVGGGILLGTYAYQTDPQLRTPVVPAPTATATEHEVVSADDPRIVAASKRAVERALELDLRRNIAAQMLYRQNYYDLGPSERIRADEERIREFGEGP